MRTPNFSIALGQASGLIHYPGRHQFAFPRGGPSHAMAKRPPPKERPLLPLNEHGMGRVSLLTTKWIIGNLQ